jgi:type II secretory pathway pseudopilin PulG
LIELLVATAVVAMVLVLLLQITSNTSQITQSSQAKIERGTDLRQSINRISADFGQGIFAKDLPPRLEKAAGNDQLGFIAEVSSYQGDRRISRVHYRIGPGADGILQRGVRGHTWSPESPVRFGQVYAFDMVPDDFEDLGKLVFRLEWEALLDDGTVESAQSLASWDNVRAIIVTIVGIDPRAWQRRPAGLTLQGLAALFPDSRTTPAGTTLLQDWSQIIEKPGIGPLANLPPTVFGGFEVRQRVIPIRR